MMHAETLTSPSRLRAADDDRLWAAVREGERGAFEELYRRYNATAFRVAARICGREAAEDSVQAAFLAIWRSRCSYDPALGSLRTWILTVVRNRAIDSLRVSSRPSHEVAGGDHHPEPVDPRLVENEVAARETGTAVREAVAELPPDQRQVIELAYFDEYSHREIASALQLPLGTVKGRTRLAFAKLPRRLGAHHRDALAVSG